MSIVRGKKIDKKDITPSVSLIIAAYNEEKIIEEKIKNCFRLDYPRDKLEIIVVSDGSIDSTPQIVKEYNPQGVQGLFLPPRRGKTAALNRAVAVAKGEIIVFSDANSMYEPKAIAKLVGNFNDPSIGGVCGRKSIVKNAQRESSQGDSLFWDLESRLKTMQSHAGSISNGDGEIFAIRRHLYEPIPEDVINDDQAITFNIVKNGYRVVYEPLAISYEEASIVISDDFKVKARMVTGGYQTIARYKKFLLPPKNYFAFQFFSHKIIRYVMPFLIILLFFCNMFLLKGELLFFFLLQLLFYIFASAGYFLNFFGFPPGIFYVPYYYCTMNVAALFGFYYFLTGKAGVSVWKKASR
ncbi:MAG: glycosyltransferase family 2 protein [Desulfobulbaceae bacterium]|nr:glycosyltransferase family 2 protein [Desulfobulbaceae bacterium]